MFLGQDGVRGNSAKAYWPDSSVQPISPGFRIFTPEHCAALNISDISCLPESKSPEEQSLSQPSIERRLVQKFQASRRRLEELRQRRNKLEAGLIRDRPFVSQKSKKLAAHAEERFWKSHLTPQERSENATPVVLEVSNIDKKPPHSSLSKLPPKAKLTFSNTPSYPSLKQRIKAVLATEPISQKSFPSCTEGLDSRKSLKRGNGFRSTGRRPLVRRTEREGDVLRNNESQYYRSLSPAVFQVSFQEGCDFERLEQV